MKYGNCLVFALKLWIKHGPAHSYLIIRKSRYAWVPHIMWTKNINDVYVEEYKPIRTNWGPLTKWFPFSALWFRGRIRKGWGEENVQTKIGPINNKTED